MTHNPMPPIESSKKTITALVQERVRQAILEGVLPAGSRIDQNQLATSLDVSLVPVREALKILEGEGFVQIIPRRGAFVAAASSDDMEDLYFTRQILEGQAAYHAAEKMTAEHIRRLEELYTQMEVALHEHDYHGFMAGNRAFHFVIYNAPESHYLSNVIANLWDLSERYRYRYVYLKDQGTEIQREHHEIIETSRRHDARALRNAIITHMQHTLDTLRACAEAEDTASTRR